METVCLKVCGSAVRHQFFSEQKRRDVVPSAEQESAALSAIICICIFIAGAWKDEGDSLRFFHSLYVGLGYELPLVHSTARYDSDDRFHEKLLPGDDFSGNK